LGRALHAGLALLEKGELLTEILGALKKKGEEAKGGSTSVFG